ncbi:hypothetical protein PIB30_073316 [Stylosanthes scabra]|uniref:Uncharacterized protein n=1 Tax=Stylosanthes scabra TaxID=79078 RepID=A0ABU6RQJ2_9FABA|nr:hypothetical protein [Stylosanthes scabra]
MNHMSLNGRKLFVGKARNRRDNKTLVVNKVVKRDIVQDVLDEWSFSYFNRSEAFNVPVLKNHLAELVVMNYNRDEKHDGLTLLPYEILNEWNFGKKNKLDRSENESSEQTVTRSFGEKECDENNLNMLEDVGVELEGAMNLNGSLATNESVCSSGVGIDEVVKEGSHDKQILSKRKEKEANLMERSSKLVMGERRLAQTAENGLGVSDDEENFMAGLKELNEARELKRREAKKKEKTRKSRLKKLKL